MSERQIEVLLENLRSRPEQDQAELLEVAHDIEARRSGVYRATPDELAAIDNADQTGIATEREIEAAFRTLRAA